MVLLFVLILCALVLAAVLGYVLARIIHLVWIAAVNKVDASKSRLDSAPYPPYDPSNANHNPSGFRHGDPSRFDNTERFKK